VVKPRVEITNVETPAPRAAAPVAKAPPPAPVVVAAPPAAAELEGADPDQLLAEATVYLRYGKYERAVGALRSILAQEPGHRPALEALGEALLASGETSHAVTAWQRAADAALGAGDTEAVARIRERIEAADPEAALPGPAPAAAGADEDVEIDIDLGDSLEAEEDPTLAAADDLDSLTIDLDAIEPLGGDELAPAQPAPAGLSLTPDEPTATTPARVAEDLEEAEFYFEQGLLDEALAFYERILAAAPNHPQAMLRLGEIAARSGGPAPAPPAPAPVPAPAPALPPAPQRIEIAAPELDIDLGPELDLPEPDDATPQPVELAPPPAPVAAPAPAPAPVPAPAPPPALVQAEITSPSLEGIASADSGDFDLAAELALGADEPIGRTLAGTEEEAFEQVFNAFKTGVERELGEGDHEARYDLGIAYKEMGLLEDAIAAFQLAMDAPARRLACLHMMGLCALDLGRAADAVAHLEQALSLPDLPSDQRVPLRYDAGRAYAALGDAARARAAFEEVRAADPGFGDVEQELARLAKAPAAAANAAGRGEETYESFDDLLAETPVPAAAQRYESFDDLFGDDSDDERPEPEAPEAAAAAAEEPPPEPEPAPEPPARVEPPAEAEPPPPASVPAAPRRKRKISFV
jgi:tetratricopeptide (TPR) repeat protein